MLVGFGLGPRNCIGQHLALVQSKVAIIKFYQRYSNVKIPNLPTQFKWKFLYKPDDFKVRVIKNWLYDYHFSYSKTFDLTNFILSFLFLNAIKNYTFCIPFNYKQLNLCLLSILPSELNILHPNLFWFFWNQKDKMLFFSIGINSY